MQSWLLLSSLSRAAKFKRTGELISEDCLETFSSSSCAEDFILILRTRALLRGKNRDVSGGAVAFFEREISDSESSILSSSQLSSRSNSFSLNAEFNCSNWIIDVLKSI